jgi:hypothetical protein
MNIEMIVSTIDEEVKKLQQARDMLSGIEQTPLKRTVGRPKGSKGTPAKQAKRVMSEEARAKIAAAQKKRWAVAKKAK